MLPACCCLFAWLFVWLSACRLSAGKTQTEWEAQLFHKHAFSTTAVPREQYLTLLSKRDYYGAVM